VKLKDHSTSSRIHPMPGSGLFLNDRPQKLKELMK